MPPCQSNKGAYSHYHHRGLVEINSAKLRCVQAQEIKQKAPNSIVKHINQHQIAWFEMVRKTSPQPQQQNDIGEVPERLV